MTLSKYKTYPEYKDSEVDWVKNIPSHWNVVPFFGEVTPCKRPNKGMIEDNLLSLSFGRIIRKDINTGDGLLPASFETYQVVEKGDEVFRLTDLQNDHRSLRSARVYERGIITSAYLAVTPQFSHLAYFSHLMRSYDTTKVFYSMGGGLRQSLKFDDMRRLPVIVPPQEEQEAIANYIDRETSRIDRLIEKKERFIELLKEKRQALITHAVTKGLPAEAAAKAGLDPKPPMKDSGIEWIGEVPAHWEVYPLKRELSFITSGSRGWAEFYSDDGSIFLRIGNLSRGTFDLNLSDIQRVCPPEGTEGSRTKVNPNDVLFSITAYLGSVAVVPQGLEEAYVSQHIALTRLKGDRLLPNWLGYFTLSDCGQIWLQSMSYGGTKVQLSLDDIKDMPVVVAPISEQIAIAQTLKTESENTEKLIAKTHHSIDLLKERRTALITAAVTGQIDVRESA